MRFFACLLLALPPPSRAADVPVLRGQLQADSRIFFPDLFISMEEVANRTGQRRVDVAVDGSFQLRSVPTGDYILRVTGIRGETIYQQYVTVQEHMSEFVVHLPDSVRRPSAPGTISLTQLRHPPSKKAVQSFAAASRFSSGGKYQEAAAELEKAIRISPEFAEAYTNLAAQHIHMRRFAEAAEESAQASRLAGPDPVNLCNRAYALYQLHRFEEAAGCARQALRLDSGYLQAHLVLGCVLGQDPAHRDEAIAHLQRAAEKFPSAQANLDRLRAAPR